MKLFLNIIKYLCLSVVLLFLFALITRHYFLSNNSELGRMLEYGFCIVLCLVAAIIEFKILDFARTKKQRIFVGLITAALCAITVIFAHNYWRSIVFNKLFNWVDPVFGLDMVLYDLSHLNLKVIANYLIPFILMLGVFAVELFIKNKGVFITGTLENLYLGLLKGKSTKHFLQYVNSMPYREDGKSEMLYCVNKYQDPLFVFFLYKKYGQILTEEEHLKHRTGYLEIIDNFKKSKQEEIDEINSYLIALDEKFEVNA